MLQLIVHEHITGFLTNCSVILSTLPDRACRADCHAVLAIILNEFAPFLNQSTLTCGQSRSVVQELPRLTQLNAAQLAPASHSLASGRFIDSNSVLCLCSVGLCCTPIERWSSLRYTTGIY